MFFSAASVPKRIAALIVPLILIVLPAVLLYRALLLGEVFVPARLLQDVAPWRVDWDHVRVPWNPLQWDGIGQFYPWRTFAAASIRSGILPLWNPHQFCGTPFAANAQSAIFYPLNLLFVILPNGAAFGMSVWLHLALTGSFAYLFLCRALGRSRTAALFGAVTWQLCTWQVSWLALPTFLCVSAWLPLALLLANRTATVPTARSAGALGACLGLMVLAGHFQIFLYCILLIAAYYLSDASHAARGATALPGEDGNLSKSIGNRIGAGVLVTAIMILAGCAQLLPSIELSRFSHRAGGAVNWTSYQGYLKLATPPFHLVSLASPDFFGNPTDGTYWGVTNYAENACYIGIIGIVLAVLGIAAWKTLPQTRFFTLAAVVALLGAVGAPIDALFFFGIPGFAQTGSPGRILVLWSFCGSILAACGLDSLLALAPGMIVRRLLMGAGIALVALAAITVYLKIWTDQNIGPGALATNLALESNVWRMPAGLLMIVFLIGVAAGAGRVSPAAFARTCVAITAVDLLISGIGYNPTAKAADVYPETPAIAFLQRHASDGRVMPVNRTWSLNPGQPPQAILPPNAATVYGLDDTQGYDSLFPGQYMAFAARLNGDGRSPAPQENGNMVFTRGVGSAQAREASVRYVVSLGPIDAPPGFEPVFSNDPIYVYEDTLSQPRVTDGVGNALAVHEDSANQISIQTAQGTSGTGTESIVVHDQFYPGWKATADGKPVAITPAPDIFRTINLPPNVPHPSRVTLTFAPASVQCGIYGLCLAIAILAGLATTNSRPRRRQSRTRTTLAGESQ